MSKRSEKRHTAQDTGNQEVLEGVPVSAEDAIQSGHPLVMRVGGGVAGAVAGRVAGKALRPAARKIATRFGVPAAPIVRVIEVAAPVALSMAMAAATRRKARKRAGHEAPGAMKLTADAPQPHV